MGPPLKERGVAMMIAIFAVALIMIYASSMVIDASVDLRLAEARRDALKAEYMAKSGLNLATFLLMTDYGVDTYLSRTQNVNPQDGPGDLWSMINQIPIGGDSADLLGSMQEKFDLDTVNDESILDTLKLFDGSFAINIEDEGGKIPLSHCNFDGRCTNVVQMLTALFSCPVEAEWLKEKNLRPDFLVGRIKDYLDDNTQAEEATGDGDESSAYRDADPPYGAKNVPLDSLNELRLVPGWDHELHTVFGPYLTPYPYASNARDAGRVNLNSASRELLFCLFPEAQANCRDKFLKSYQASRADKKNLATSDAQIATYLTDQVCDEQATTKAPWFSTTSQVYRIVVEGVVGDQTKRLEVVLQRRFPDAAKKKLSAYQFLYWKLI